MLGPIEQYGIPYMRIRGAPGGVSEVMGPKAVDHPSIGCPCLACGQPLQAGDLTVLVPLGPGDDDEARAKCAAFRFYNAVAVECHAACVLGYPVEKRDDNPSDGA